MSGSTRQNLINEISSAIKGLDKYKATRLDILGIFLHDATFKSFKLLDKYIIGIEGIKIHFKDNLEQDLFANEEEMDELLKELEQRFNQAIRF